MPRYPSNNFDNTVNGTYPNGTPGIATQDNVANRLEYRDKLRANEATLGQRAKYPTDFLAGTEDTGVTYTAADGSTVVTFGPPTDTLDDMITLLGIPVVTAVASSGGGSTLAANTYYYKVTAVDQYGHEGNATEVSVSTTVNYKNTLTWPAINDAASYNVYRTLVSGTYTAPAFLTNVTALTFVDLNAVALSGTNVPPSGTTALSGGSINTLQTEITSLVAAVTALEASTTGNLRNESYLAAMKAIKMYHIDRAAQNAAYVLKRLSAEINNIASSAIGAPVDGKYPSDHSPGVNLYD